MNGDLIYPILLIISGIVLSVLSIILLDRFFKNIIRFFELYPESKGILKFSLKIISRLTGLIVFLVLLRLALRIIGLDFTTAFVEQMINIAPKYIVALIIVLLGFYLSRLLREKSRTYEFKFKNQLLLFIDFMINMAFIMTAFAYVGINIGVFLEIYKVFLWTIGIIIALVVSMIIGIPLAINLYKKAQNSSRNKKNPRINLDYLQFSPSKDRFVRKAFFYFLFCWHAF